ncbi:MAG: protein translocase subunit SecD, partial [Syntrophales bacterium]
FDSNLTTLIAALFLFGFGTGPVKGFAVTLTIGLIANMFTAVFVTRIIYDYFIWNRKIQTISV